MHFSILATSVVTLAASAMGSQHNHRSEHRRHHAIAVREPGHMVEFGKRFENCRFTFYDVGLGACGQYNVASDFIVALNTPQYGGGYPGPNCFKTITITANGKTAQATIMDQCPGCPFGGLDFSRGLFNYFASEDAGVITGSWVFNDGAGGGGGPAPTTKEEPKPTTTKEPPKPTTTWTPEPTTTWTPEPTTTWKPEPTTTKKPEPTTTWTPEPTTTWTPEPTTSSTKEEPTSSSTPPPPSTSSTHSSTHSDTPSSSSEAAPSSSAEPIASASASASSSASASASTASASATSNDSTLGSVNQAVLALANLGAAGAQSNA